jgi:cleavage and polyadenylation specificity factor subunit 4
MAEVQDVASPKQQVDQASQAPLSFNFSDFLRREYRFGLDPDRPLCKAYMQGHCPLGNRCPDKHQIQNSYSKYVTIAMRSLFKSLIIRF